MRNFLNVYEHVKCLWTITVVAFTHTYIFRIIYKKSKLLMIIETEISNMKLYEVNSMKKTQTNQN